MARDYRRFSLWLDTVSDDLAPRPALGSDIDVDIVIAGAGYTGLWTAYYLAEADPDLRIAVVEKEIAGFGASGRNGGWASAAIAGGEERIVAAHGADAAARLKRALFDTIDEIERVCTAEDIDAHYRKGGSLTVASTPAQVAHLAAEIELARTLGFEPEDLEWLGSEELDARLLVTSSLGAVFTPHCAAIHPARLVRGLATAVERRGVTIYEQTPALALQPGCVRTPHGRVRADIVVRALEGYTPALPHDRRARLAGTAGKNRARLGGTAGQNRALVPIYSLMIATEPLPASFWNQVGWRGHETLTDGRNLIIYAQRTADDRIAIGGRGAPYHFGSRVHDSYDRDPGVFHELHTVLRSLFPQAADATITHRWGGPLGVPRDWRTSIGFDRPAGAAWAGGYVGDGVSTANLAGRTLRDLICGRDTELVRLPLVGHRWRRWEPEPLRWIGANLALRAMASADMVEARTGRRARRAAVAAKLLGM